MSRYIDADKVLRFISLLTGAIPLVLLREIEKNGIDIVFCKECKHCEYADMKVHLWCDRQERYVYADDFCSFGERSSE